MEIVKYQSALMVINRFGINRNSVYWADSCALFNEHSDAKTLSENVGQDNTTKGWMLTKTNSSNRNILIIILLMLLDSVHYEYLSPSTKAQKV